MKKDPSQDLYARRHDLVAKLAEQFSFLGSPALSERVKMALKEDHLKLISLSVDPKGYQDWEEFRTDYLLCEAFSKYPYWDVAVDRKAVALQKFHEMETHCGQTNKRLLSPSNWGWTQTSVMASASRLIEKLLGPFNWDEAVRFMDFGPGSTTRLRKDKADTYYKFGGSPQCTHNCLPLSSSVLTYFTAWGTSLEGTVADKLKVVLGNKVITVPKNAKTDRVIAKEPCMNVFIQKGIGGVIRRRLRKVGVDLNDQTRNQELCREASLSGELATIDLSSASDTVSYEIVRCLLPPDWFDAMSLCRSEKGVLPDGEAILYRKFSSMGNGFTFELESLIFWALARAVSDYVGEKDRRLAVYGDDLIVPVSMSEAFCTTLAFAGFIVNAKKSHFGGPFRESCGKHYFRGNDVTPIYFKDKVDSVPRYIWAANQLKRWSRHPVYGLKPELKDAYDLIVKVLPAYWRRPRIPDGVGDGALIGDFDEVLPKKAPRGFCGWKTRFYSVVMPSYLPDLYPICLKSLWALEKRQGECVDDVDQLPVATGNRRYKLTSGVVQQWPSFGPWQV